MNIVKWYKNRSFQFKLVIGYLVLALIPMLCVTWYSYGKTRNVLLTEAYQLSLIHISWTRKSALAVPGTVRG